MSSPAHSSDQTMQAASRSLANQRAGGRRGSIGRGSAKMKWQHFGRKIRNITLALAGLAVGMIGVGLVLDGIGWTGIIITLLAAVIVTVVLARYPSMPVPKRADLSSGNIRQLVGQTELWLENQRRALPAPAVKLVDHIGLQLDALGLQLDQIDANHPAAGEIRKLVGTDLPDVIDGYRRIPEHLRFEAHSGTTPNAQFMTSLETISGEIDSVTRQLASGAIDNLAIKTRYLGYKYGAGIAETTPAEQP